MGGNLYPDLVRLLEEAGCRLVRTGKGSHEIWYSPRSRRNLTVPRNTTVVGTANKVSKDAGLPKKF